MKDLRIAVPVITNRSDPQGRTPPSGFLFPRISRLDSDKRPQLLDGIQKVVQQIYLEMFTDPQPNGVGSGFATALRRAQADNFNAIVQTGVSDLLTRMQKYQQALDLPQDERVASLSIIEARFDEQTATFLLALELVTDAGTAYELRPPLV